MNEIKFRLRKDNKIVGYEMLYSQIDKEDGKKKLFWMYKTIDDPELITWIDCDGKDLFTGLHDKNGKDIYEEDILFFENVHVKRYSRIVWNSKEAKFVQKITLFFNSSKHPKTVHCFNNLSNGLDKLEVIGNTHENPDLIKRKDDI